jgi:predicted Zn-dependent protease
VIISLFQPENRKKQYMRDLANRALNIAQQLGASYVDVRVMERTTEGIAVKNGRVEGISSGTSSGFNVRVIVDGPGALPAPLLWTMLRQNE